MPLDLSLAPGGTIFAAYSNLCCRVNSFGGGHTCYDTDVPVSSTADVWSFRNYCVGGQLGTAYYDAACSPDGTCVPE